MLSLPSECIGRSCSLLIGVAVLCNVVSWLELVCGGEYYRRYGEIALSLEMLKRFDDGGPLDDGGFTVAAA